MKKQERASGALFFIAMIAMIVVPALPVYSATVTSVGSGDWDVGGTWSSGSPPGASDDVVIAAGHSVTIDDALTHSINSLTVQNTGYLYHKAQETTWNNASGLPQYKIDLNVTNNVTVNSGGYILASERGFSRGKGPQSASHGGCGVGGSGGRNTYGSESSPVTIGSGGNYTNGGGAIKIVSGGTVTINGTIATNGSSSGGSGHIGGAGGSIWIIADTIAGTGNIQAKGGSATNGGGGGRISLNVNGGTNSFTFLGNIDSMGGGGSKGHAGTVYFGGTPNVRIANEKYIKMGGAGETTLNNLTIDTGGVLYFDSHPRSGATNGNSNTGYEGKGNTINVANLTVNGVMNGNGLGFNRSYTGPGGQSGKPGTHGGSGSGGMNTLPLYGSITQPTTPGSGGNYTTGGGAIKIVASGTAAINGTIAANGASGVGTGHVGGAGGSIWIEADTFTGNGSIQARGGSGNSNGTGGGGGRIALDTTGGVDRFQYTGDVNTEGGTGRFSSGQGGTVSFGNSPNVRVANTKIIHMGGGFDVTVNNLTVDSGGFFYFGADTRAGASNGISNTGREGKGLTLNANNVTINGTMSGYALGFDPPAAGPGGGQYGGTHGGRGARSTRPLYGSSAEPTTPGSAGSQGYGSGAIKLNVAGTLTVNGTLTANGGYAGRSSYAGAGGSIWILANTLAGNGTISANGGNAAGGRNNGSGGGGGRVAIYANNRTFHSGTTVDNLENAGFVTSLAGVGTSVGNPGTVYIEVSDASKLVFIDGYPLEVIVEECSDAFQIELQDSSNDPVATAANLSIELSEVNYGEPSVTFYSDSGCSNSITEIDLNEGETQTDVFYMKYTGGTLPATLNLNGTLTGLTTAETSDITAKAALNGFTVAPEDGVYTKISGSSFNLTVTAIDAEGATSTSYTGTANITIAAVSPTTGVGSYSPSSTALVGFTAGVSTISFTYNDGGYITVSAADSSDPTKSGTSSTLTFVPSTFTVEEADAETKTVNKVFDMTITAKNASGSTMPNYDGSATLSIDEYVTPDTDQQATVSPTALDASAWTSGVADVELTYDKWGSVKFKVADDTLATQTGTSDAVMFYPKDFVIEALTIPESRTFFYPDETFTATVTVRDENADVIANYLGTVEFVGADLTLPNDYTFLQEDAGVHAFSGISASEAATTTLMVRDNDNNVIVSEAIDVTVQEATVQAATTGGPVGKLPVLLQLLDAQGDVIAEDDATTITVSLEDQDGDGSATVDTSLPVTVSNGVATIYVTNTEAETVTVTPVSSPSLDAEEGVLTYGIIAGRGIGIESWREIKSKGRYRHRNPE